MAARMANRGETDHVSASPGTTGDEAAAGRVPSESRVELSSHHCARVAHWIKTVHPDRRYITTRTRGNNLDWNRPRTAHSRATQHHSQHMPGKRGPSPSLTPAEWRAAPRQRWARDNGLTDADGGSAPHTPTRRRSPETRENITNHGTGTTRTRREGFGVTRNRQPAVVLPGGGAREIERRGVHITVNVARARSRTRSRTPRGRTPKK